MWVWQHCFYGSGSEVIFVLHGELEAVIWYCSGGVLADTWASLEGAASFAAPLSNGSYFFCTPHTAGPRGRPSDLRASPRLFSATALPQKPQLLWNTCHQIKLPPFLCLICDSPFPLTLGSDSLSSFGFNFFHHFCDFYIKNQSNPIPCFFQRSSSSFFTNDCTTFRLKLQAPSSQASWLLPPIFVSYFLFFPFKQFFKPYHETQTFPLYSYFLYYPVYFL